MTDNQISKDFFRWMKEGNTGCAFVKMFALQEDEPWESVVIRGSTFDSTVHSVLNDHLNQASERSEAIQFLFPQVKTAEQIAKLIVVLCKSPDWYCVQITPVDGEVQSAILLGLRRLLPDKKHVNWVLGFANIETMPQTRQSPCTALLLRLGGPGASPSIARSKPHEIDNRKREHGYLPVHLADVPMPLQSEGIKKMWDKTENDVQAILNSNPEIKAAAHVKISFSLPKVVIPLLAEIISGSDTTSFF